jgi:FkbM family methyltransferase
VPRGSLVFDVGANRGERSDVFLELGARVVAVEPVEATARLIDAWLGDDPRFTLVRKAAGAAEGKATIHVANFDVLSSLAPDWVEACKQQPHLREARWTEQTVAVTTLDCLIAEHGVPAFAKIDVEGFEVEVLKGLSRPIPALSFEYTPFRPEPALECLRLLHAFGKARFNSSRGDSLVLAHERWLDYDAMVNFCRNQVPQEPLFGDVYAVFDGAVVLA